MAEIKGGNLLVPVSAAVYAALLLRCRGSGQAPSDEALMVLADALGVETPTEGSRAMAAYLAGLVPRPTLLVEDGRGGKAKWGGRRTKKR